MENDREELIKEIYEKGDKWNVENGGTSIGSFENAKEDGVDLSILEFFADFILNRERTIREELAEAKKNNFELAMGIAGDINTESKHNCEKWQEEGMGCSICSNHTRPIAEVKELQEHINWKIADLERRLGEAQESLKEAYKSMGDHDGH